MTFCDECIALMDEIDQVESGCQSDIDLCARAANLADAHPDCVNSNYIAGYAFYNADRFSTYESTIAKRYLTLALRLDPHHTFARLYLGHAYFDCGEYEDALREFELVETSQLEDAGQVWRIAKLTELELCCKMATGATLIDDFDIQKMKHAYSKVEKALRPAPKELAEFYVESGSDIPVPLRRRVLRFLKDSEYYSDLKDIHPSLALPDNDAGNSCA